MEGENYVEYCSRQVMSPEIVEIGEESKSFTNSKDGSEKDVYVAVGKNDLDVLKWALDHLVLPGGRIFLVHAFPLITYIPTPVGRLSRSQLSAEQVKYYINEENNRRRNHLHKYIHLCTDAKVPVDTMLLESDSTAKAILDLIPVLNITKLVMGTKRPSPSRGSRKKMGKGRFVEKNAPKYCEVTIVYGGKKVQDAQEVTEQDSESRASSARKSEMNRQSERNFFECVCFSGKFK